jgi:hypothetical protein
MTKRKSLARPELTRAHLRAIRTFSGRVEVGTDVASQQTKSRQEAVRNAAKKYKRSERYVWGTVKLGRRLYRTAMETLKKVPPSPRFIAEAFLANTLGNDQMAAKEIEAQARNALRWRNLRRYSDGAAEGWLRCTLAQQIVGVWRLMRHQSLRTKSENLYPHLAIR